MVANNNKKLHVFIQRKFGNELWEMKSSEYRGTATVRW